ncbi:hypothetical protein DFH06DRAFT_1239492 [Mycena polygramma]|nr:hypothetical protein DFH06DRAFT_1239492 [Mycena polygramma]
MPQNPVGEACRKLQERLYYHISEDPIATLVPRSCRLVRDWDPADSRFSDVVNRVSETVNIGVGLAYSTLEIDYLPSFAHTREFPLLQGPNTFYNIFKNNSTPRIYEILSEFGNICLRQWGTNPIFVFCFWIFNRIFTSLLPKPWASTPRPHESSSLLSRFAPNPSSHPPGVFRNIYEARCEISSDHAACEPLRIVNNGSCLVIPSMTGHRQQAPILAYYLLDDTTDKSFPLRGRYAEVGLSEVAYPATTDEARKLIVLGDSYRVKSYAWANALTGEVHNSALPTHTLASAKHTGPLAVLTSGTLLRAGKGSAAVWTLDGLPTHGRTGTKHIGRRFNYEGWRGDYDEIAASSGSPSTEDYSFIALDLENGGKTVVRYFGNGGGNGDFSTSKGDHNTFATGASDGHARLYGTRLPLPVVTFCAGTALIHPDGVPALFTGSTKDQVLRLWDIRARTMVMTWDDRCTCRRPAASWTAAAAPAPASMLPEPEPVPPRWMCNNDDSDEGPCDKCWPKQAIHSEDYWGAVFDAGNHHHPEPILPEYGSTVIRENSYY